MRITPRGELLLALLAIVLFVLALGVAGSLDLTYNTLPNDR